MNKPVVALDTPIRLTKEHDAPNTLRYSHDSHALPRFQKLYIVTDSLPANMRDRDLIMTLTVAPRRK